MSGPLSTNAPFSNFGQAMILRDIEQLYLLIGERNGDLGDTGYGTSSVGQYGPGGDLRGPNKGVKNPSTSGGAVVKYLGTLDVPVFGGSVSVAGTAAGVGAVDWQQFRGTSAQVAGGAYATISGGSNNTADGVSSTVIGGSNNWAITDFSIAGGYNCWAGDYVGTLPTVSLGYNLNAGNGSVAIGYSPTSISVGIGAVHINSQANSSPNSIAIGSGAVTSSNGDISIKRGVNTTGSWKIKIGGDSTFAPNDIRIGDTTNSSTGSYIIGYGGPGVVGGVAIGSGVANCTACVAIGGSVGAISTTYAPNNVCHIGPTGSSCYNGTSTIAADVVSLGGGFLGQGTPGIKHSLIYTSTAAGISTPYFGGLAVPKMTRSILLQGSPESSWTTTSLVNSIRIWSDGASSAREFGGAISDSAFIGGFIQKELSYFIDALTISKSVGLTNESIVNKTVSGSVTDTITRCAFIGSKTVITPLSTISISVPGTYSQTGTGTFLGNIYDANTDTCVAILGDLGSIGTATTQSGVVVIKGTAVLSLTNTVVIGCDYDGTNIYNTIKVAAGDTIVNNFGCNGKAAQGTVASGGAVATTAGATYTATEQAMLGQLKTLCNNIRTALVNNGIMS
jgi:hypothetical protein